MNIFNTTHPTTRSVVDFDIDDKSNALVLHLENKRKVVLKDPKVSVVNAGQIHTDLLKNSEVLNGIRHYLTQEHSTVFPNGVDTFDVKKISDFNYAVYLNYRIVARIPLATFSLTKVTSVSGNKTLVTYEGSVKFVPVIRSRIRPLSAQALPMVLLEQPTTVHPFRKWFAALLGLSTATTASALFYVSTLGL